MDGDHAQPNFVLAKIGNHPKWMLIEIMPMVFCFGGTL
jgi:hypothetical protein